MKKKIVLKKYPEEKRILMNSDMMESIMDCDEAKKRCKNTGK